MKITTRIRTFAILGSIAATALFIDIPFSGQTAIKNVEARLGRPLTPASVAGVARRTTRRTIRRSTIYLATLPRGCTTVTIEGTLLHHCGGTYYQSYNGQYAVVYVD